MAYNFQDFPCNKCGWCCQRTPCPLALYLGQKPLSPCQLLVETSPHQFECGLILNEKDQIKQAALKELIFSGKGCSHIYGPHPLSVLRDLMGKGLNKSMPQWQEVKNATEKEYRQMASESLDSESILSALNEFKQFCVEEEGHV